MQGMNLFFHLGAAAASVALAWLLLRVQRQRDLLRHGVDAVAVPNAKGHARFAVESPAKWLEGFAAALGISYENPDSWDLPPRRILVGDWMRLVLARQVSLIRCRKSPDGSQDSMNVELVGPGGDSVSVTLGKETP